VFNSDNCFSRVTYQLMSHVIVLLKEIYIYICVIS